MKRFILIAIVISMVVASMILMESLIKGLMLASIPLIGLALIINNNNNTPTLS